MKGRIVDQRATVYSQPDAMSQALAELKAGTEIEIEGTKKVGEASWIQLRGANGQPGWLQPGTRVFVVRQAVLNQPTASAYAQPGTDGPAVREYSQGALFTLLDTTTVDGAAWVKIRDALGNEAYLPASTRLATGEAAAAAQTAARTATTGAATSALPRGGAGSTGKAAGRQTMIRGTLWLVGGAVLTCVTYSIASKGGTYIVFWGAILIGIIQIVRGMIQYFSASS